jgi:hypothetical protein
MTIMQIALDISLHTKGDDRNRCIMQGTWVEASSKLISKLQHAFKLFIFLLLSPSFHRLVVGHLDSRPAQTFPGVSFAEKTKPLRTENKPQLRGLFVPRSKHTPSRLYKPVS